MIELTKVLIKDRVWFEDAAKQCRMLWEGLFFMFWHSDKSIYQRDTSLRIAQLLYDLSPMSEKASWSDH